MDGRPHPPAWAPATWMGFSTGKWEGDILVVTTTHIKQEWIRRNGVPNSDRSTMIEHFIRHGNILTHMVQWTDPVNLTEPLLRSEEFVLQERTAGNWLWPCEYVDEVADRPRGEVPHYLPGKSPYAGDFAWRYGVPLEAASRRRGDDVSRVPRQAPHAAQAHQAGAPVAAPGPRQSMAGIHRVVLCAVAGALACGAHVLTQGAQRPAADWGSSGDIHTFHVQGNVHLVVGAGGNVAVQAGPDGVLFVDTGMAAHAEKLLDVVRKDLSHGPIRWVVNTHADEDHTGGNEVIGKAGSTTNNNPTPIVAHENVLTRMSLPGGGQTPRPTAAWPTSSYVKGTKDFFFNDEPVMVYHVPTAHTDGDSVVLFRRSDVVMAGDLYVTTTYPRIDLGAGGGVQGVIDGLNLILDLAVPKHEQEGGTYVIPGTRPRLGRGRRPRVPRHGHDRARPHRRPAAGQCDDRPGEGRPADAGLRPPVRRHQRAVHDGDVHRGDLPGSVAPARRGAQVRGEPVLRTAGCGRHRASG